MTFDRAELLLLWEAVSAHAENQGDMLAEVEVGNYDPAKIEAAEALRARFDALFVAP